MATLARKAQSDASWISFAATFSSGDVGTRVRAIDSWCRDHYRYRDESEEIVRSPEFMLQDLASQGFVEGDCDDIATFIVAILKTLGIPARLFAMQSQPGGTYDHVFAEGYGGTWIPIDPTVTAGTVYTVYSQLIEYV